MANAIRTYKSTCIAKAFLDRATRENKTFTPMQLIKLVYLAHGWMLALYNRPLTDETIEAWQYGPVIPDLYHAIKQYRGNPVQTIDCEDAILDDDASDVIDQVYQQYGHLNGIKLSMVTHEKNSPWEKTWNNNKVIISNDLITDYYQELSANA